MLYLAQLTVYSASVRFSTRPLNCQEAKAERIRRWKMEVEVEVIMRVETEVEAEAEAKVEVEAVVRAYRRTWDGDTEVHK